MNTEEQVDEVLRGIFTPTTASAMSSCMIDSRGSSIRIPTPQSISQVIRRMPNVIKLKRIQGGKVVHYILDRNWSAFEKKELYEVID